MGGILTGLYAFVLMPARLDPRLPGEWVCRGGSYRMTIATDGSFVFRTMLQTKTIYPEFGTISADLGQKNATLFRFTTTGTLPFSGKGTVKPWQGPRVVRIFQLEPGIPALILTKSLSFVPANQIQLAKLRLAAWLSKHKF